jgi:uncharacterized RDD family membrane protein YckC
MSDESHYDALGVSPNASKEKIREAYQAALEAARADQQRESVSKRPNESAIGTARAEEARVRAAWQVLSDPYQRGRYDATLEMGAQTNGAAGAAVDADEDATDEVDTRTDEERAMDDATPPWRKKQRQRQLAAAARAPVVTADGTPLELAGPGRRAMAAVIDIAVVMLGWGTALGIALAADYNDNTVAVIQQAVMLGLFLGYFLFPTIRRGQSLGKKLTHIMLVDRTTGHLPTANKALMHYLPTLFALFLFGPQGGGPLAVLVGLSFLMTRDGMSLGDKLAKTAVVIARYRPERVR